MVGKGESTERTKSLGPKAARHIVNPATAEPRKMHLGIGAIFLRTTQWQGESLTVVKRVRRFTPTSRDQVTTIGVETK